MDGLCVADGFFLAGEESREGGGPKPSLGICVEVFMLLFFLIVGSKSDSSILLVGLVVLHVIANAARKRNRIASLICPVSRIWFSPCQGSAIEPQDPHCHFSDRRLARGNAECMADILGITLLLTLRFSALQMKAANTLFASHL